MTFLHTRDGLALTSTCVLCGMSTRSLSESAIYLSQRGHDAVTCQRRRAEERVMVEEPEPERVVGRPSLARRALPKPARTHCSNGHDWTPENTSIDSRGYTRCLVCDRDRHAAKVAALRQEKEAS